MSLDWKLTGIKDYETLCWRPTEGDPEKKTLNPITNALIWGTMAAGIGVITEENADVFHARISMYECLFGSLMRTSVNGVVTDLFVQEEDVKAHIGLRTNATKESSAKWSARMFEAWLRAKTQELKRPSAQSLKC